MNVLSSVSDKWNAFLDRFRSVEEQGGTAFDKVKRVIGIIVMCLYRLRKVVLAAPVVYYAICALTGILNV